MELAADSYAASVSSEAPGADMYIHAQGKTSEPYPIEVTARLKNVNLDRIRPGTLDARLSGTMRLKGRGKSVDDFTGRGKINLDPTEVRGVKIKTADASYAIDGGRIVLSSVSARAEGLIVKGDGWIEPFGQKKPYSFQVEAESERAGLLAAWTDQAYQANYLAVDAKIEGEAERWNAKGDGQVRGLRGEQLYVPRADLEFDLKGVGSDDIEGRTRIEAKNVLAPKAAYKQIKIPVFDISADLVLGESGRDRRRVAFDIETDSKNKDYNLDAKGSLMLESGTGDFELSMEELDLTVIGQRWRSARGFTVSSRDGIVETADARLESDGAYIEASGTAVGPSLDFDLTLSRVPIQPWAENIYPGDTLSGLLSAEASLRGGAARPTMDIETEIEQGRFASVKMETLNTTFEYSNGVAEVWIAGESELVGEFRIWGELPLTASLSPAKFETDETRQMELVASAADVPVAVIDQFVPWIRDVSGHISFYADIGGTPRKPTWNGRLGLSEVGLEAPRWGLRLSGVTGGAELDDDLVTIPKIVVRSGEGEGKIKGRVKLSGWDIEWMDLVVKADDFRALNTPEMVAVLDAELEIKGDLGYPRIKGDVEFIELLYRPPLILTYEGSAWEEEDPTIIVEGEYVEQEESTNWMNRAEIDIDIDIPDTGRLRNSELNIYFGGDLKLRKPPGGFFLLFGEARANQGWVVFQGKVFRLEKGEFIFPAIPVIDPEMDILASYKVPEYTVFIKITGSLSEPLLELYSEPALGQEDILSVILFGKPTSELSEGQDQALRSAGAQLAAGFAAAELREVFPVDALILQPGTTPETSGVGVGKYINERLYIFYYHRFGEDTAEEFKLRYDITKRIAIEAGQDERGQIGADVLFTYPY